MVSLYTNMVAVSVFLRNLEGDYVTQKRSIQDIRSVFICAAS